MIAIKETRTNTLSDQEMEIVLELEDGRLIVIWHHDGYSETDTIATYKSNVHRINNDIYDSCSLPPSDNVDGPIAIKETEFLDGNSDETKIVITLDDDTAKHLCRSISICLYEDAKDDDGYAAHGDVTTYATDGEPFDDAAMPPPKPKKDKS
jgi:hypothetical protein